MKKAEARMIVVRDSPLNAEAPRTVLRTPTTPTSSFFVRTHFDMPSLEAATWKLRVDGDVDSPRDFTYDELLAMPTVTIPVTLECAGNGRKGFATAAEGEVRWGHGAVGTAIWTGVPLREVLGSCRPRKTATKVVTEGSDSGEVPGAGRVAFARSLPIEKALDAGTIVALRMNGRTLTREHGYPARLIVPGWYGMASVKWIGRVGVVSGRGTPPYFNGVKYVYVTGAGSRERREPVREMRVKSLITRPLEGEELGLGKPTEVTGMAWSGSGRVTTVEVDLGGGWERAVLGRTKGGRYAWVPWRMKWTPERRGGLVISARAADELGNVQPPEPFENRFQYGYNAVERVRITVR